MRPLGVESSAVLLSDCAAMTSWAWLMFVLFMKWGLVGAKDKLDITHIINFILKVTNKYCEWTFHK